MEYLSNTQIDTIKKVGEDHDINVSSRLFKVLGLLSGSSYNKYFTQDFVKQLDSPEKYREFFGEGGCFSEMNDVKKIVLEAIVANPDVLSSLVEVIPGKDNVGVATEEYSQYPEDCYTPSGIKSLDGFRWVGNITQKKAIRSYILGENYRNTDRRKIKLTDGTYDKTGNWLCAYGVWIQDDVILERISNIAS